MQTETEHASRHFARIAAASASASSTNAGGVAKDGEQAVYVGRRRRCRRGADALFGIYDRVGCEGGDDDDDDDGNAFGIGGLDIGGSPLAGTASKLRC